MKKLTKDQRYNRKLRKAGRPNFSYTQREDGKRGVEVSRRALSVSISLKAYEKLVELSKQEGIDRWRMLTRMIIYAIPKYSNFGDTPLTRHSWDETLLHPKERSVKYKGTKGDKQITYYITSTAWNKLECHKTATGKSKARLIQSIILNYKPTTQKQRDYMKQRNQDMREEYGYAPKPTSVKSSKQFSKKFIYRGNGLWEHVKRIPPEHWDEKEIDEYQKLTGINWDI